jgi:hypothetical protein
VHFAAPAVTFAVDSTNREIFRFQDLDADGDYNEAGERTLFYGGRFSSVLAISGTEVFAVRVLAGSAQIVRLRDMNGDGAALDTGESTVWFSGTSPSGVVPQMVPLTRASDGSIYAMQGTPLPAVQRIYRLNDDNGNGTTDDPAEITEVGQTNGLSVAEQLVLDSGGTVWITGASGVSRIVSGAQTLVLDDAALEDMGYLLRKRTLGALGDGSVIFGARSSTELDHPLVLLAVRETGEVRQVWNYALADFQSDFSALRVLEDGTIVSLHNGVVDGVRTEPNLLRLNDADQNGQFTDPGESYVMYDQYFSVMAGQSQLDLFSSMSAVLQ